MESAGSIEMVVLEGQVLERQTRACLPHRLWGLAQELISTEDFDPFFSAAFWKSPVLHFNGIVYQLPPASELSHLLQQSEPSVVWLEPVGLEALFATETSLPVVSPLSADRPSQVSELALRLGVRTESVVSVHESPGHYPHALEHTSHLPVAAVVLRRLWQVRIESSSTFNSALLPSKTAELSVEVDVATRKDFADGSLTVEGYNALHLTLTNHLAQGKSGTAPPIQNLSFVAGQPAGLSGPAIQNKPGLLTRFDLFLQVDDQLQLLDLEDADLMSR